MEEARAPLHADPATPEERATAELRGWLEAGERIVVLLAPRGAARRRVLAALAEELEGRFAATPFRPEAGRGDAARATTVEELRGARGPRSLLVVEEGERLGAEGARVLRALAYDASAERCAAVALAPEEAGAVLLGLGPGLEVVVLRAVSAPGRASWLRTAAGGAAALLAAASLGVAAALLLPRFGAAPPAPAEGIPEAPAGVAATEAASLPQGAAPLSLPQVAAPSASGSPSPPQAAAPSASRVPSPPRAASLPASGPLAHAAAPPALPPVAAPRGPRAQSAPAPAAASPEPAPPPRSPERAPQGESAARAEPPAEPAAAGWLVVNAIPRARITVDGTTIGETPIVRHPISGGRHRVSARFDDGREDTRTVEIAGREHYLLFDGRR